MNSRRRNLILVLALTLWVLILMSGMKLPSVGAAQIEYSSFIREARQGLVKDVSIQGQTITGSRHDGTHFETYDPGDPALLDELMDIGVQVWAKPPEQPGLLTQLFFSMLPIALIVAVWWWLMRKNMAGGGAGNPFSFGKSKARLMEEGQVKVTLEDVAGVEEAKQEVSELVDFLRDPSKFNRVGGRIPRGVLMVGPPGTGKTLLARAIAGEAKVPFFSISGSDFVEMFVGVGASRVRDMFEQAKQKAPCIVFIDEIDAVGRRRGAGLGGGHDEREQTLNQILVEMDGFGGNEGVIVIAATNRPDVLDPALLRPGRFDRQVVVPLPDVAGREKILRVHMRKIPVAVDVDARVIARGTPGFSGADLANLVNEAALLAARHNLEAVSDEMFEQAKDKVMMGAERRSMVMTEDDKRLTAYHEAGHTIVGRLVPDHDPVHKVSIIPRGRALGVTLFLPEQDRLSLTRRHIESRISALFGGRVAEEIVFGPDAVTTGAQNDLERATELARSMVAKWGLSDLGPIAYHDEEGEVFLGHAVSREHSVSDQTARMIDAEVRRLVDRNYDRARTLLLENRDKLELMADALMRYETLSADQIDDIMAGRPLRTSDGGDSVSGSSPRDASNNPGSGKPASGGPVVGKPLGQH